MIQNRVGVGDQSQRSRARTCCRWVVWDQVGDWYGAYVCESVVCTGVFVVRIISKYRHTHGFEHSMSVHFGYCLPERTDCKADCTYWSDIIGVDFTGVDFTLITLTEECACLLLDNL